MKLLKGIIHIHSNYSYDGQHSLEEIVQYGIRCGYSFIGMSEHSDTLDEKKMAEYVEECQRVSTPDCLMIPGIEFTCEDNLHIVGLGVQHYTDAKDPLKITEFIHQQNGIAIIAHPRRYNYQIPPDLSSAVDGIEIWNAAYDGRFVPNDQSLKLLQDLRRHNDHLLALGGQDLHVINDHFNVEIGVSYGNKFTSEKILYALKERSFVIFNPYFKLFSGNEVKGLKLLNIKVSRLIYESAAWIRNHAGM